jgi:Dockerin type I domain
MNEGEGVMQYFAHLKSHLLWCVLFMGGLLSTITFSSRNIAVVTAQVTPPVGQQTLDIWQTLDYVQINWEGKEGAVGYHVYRAVTPNDWQKVTTKPLSFSSFVDLPLSGMKIIRYRVTFLDQQGEEHGLTTTAEIVYQPPTMQLQSATQFDRNNVISDAEYVSNTSITTAQVQAFLAARNSFLAGYRLPDNRLASQAIVEESLRNQINPIQILARLQTEQGLISATNPLQTQLDYALGYGCPDTATCNQQDKGFDRQIIAATFTLHAYIQEIDLNGQTRSGWAPGRSKQTSDPLSVTPVNRATAALYTYTPWVGEGGGGRPGVGANYLFWQLYYSYAQSFDVITPINPSEVICDDQNACFSTYKSGGAWGNALDATTYLQHSSWTYNNQNTALDWGKWQPSLPQAGMYDVYVWYPQVTDAILATSAASYQVHHAAGDTNVTWNQATNPGAWNKIATVSCAAGTACYVQLTDATLEGTGTRRVWLDAVKFVQVEVICDDQDACFSTYKSGGAWGNSSDATTYLQHSSWTYNNQNTALDWGKWQPSLPQPGTYDVYVWYPQVTDAIPVTGAAAYQVHHATGDTNVAWNQATNPGAWNKIATVSCAAGTACYVQLTDATPEGTGTRRVWLDAVKFVQVLAPITYNIAGTVTSGGVGLAGVTITDGTRTATTDASGNYTLSGVPAGSYTLTPTKSGYSFSPASLSVSVSGNVTGQNFTGTPPVTPPTATATATATATQTATATATQTATTVTMTPTATATRTAMTATAISSTAMPTTTTPTATPPTVTATAIPTATPTTGSGLTIEVSLEGRPQAPSARLSVPLSVTLTLAGATTPAYQATLTTDQYGRFPLVGIVPGTYTLRVKHPQSLRVSSTVVITSGTTTLSLGLLPSGDANNDNRINLLDFSLLSSTFGKSSTTTGYDSRADFNNDNIINLLDFSLLAKNFGTAGLASFPLALTTVSTPQVVAQVVRDLRAGETFALDLAVNAPTTGIDGAAAYLTFDPTLLEVDTITGDPMLDLSLQQEIDNPNGQVALVRGTLTSPLPTGRVNLGRITFRARTSASAATITLVDDGALRQSAVTANGRTLSQTDAPWQLTATTTGYSVYLPLVVR